MIQNHLAERTFSEPVMCMYKPLYIGIVKFTLIGGKVAEKWPAYSMFHPAAIQSI